jgi:hypothetical protein
MGTIRQNQSAREEGTVDRKRLEQHLALVDYEIALNERHMQRQRELIAKLENDGEDAGEARNVLIAMEAARALRVADRELFRQELALFRQELKKIW